MAWDKWVIDGSMSTPDGIFCFCPIDGEQIITGMNVLSDKPPHEGELVGVVHMDGDDAADAFYQLRKAEIDALRETTRQKKD